jgi:biopolymer transport protein TolR
MAGGARRKGMITEINVTPLVDIVLVLLIIFMLTASVIAKQAIEVDLPKAATGSTPNTTTLAVTLSADGSIWVDGKPSDATSMRATVAAALKKDAKTTVLIAGDKGVAHGRVVWLLDVVRSLGVSSFAIQIDPNAAIAPHAPAARGAAAEKPPK